MMMHCTELVGTDVIKLKLRLKLQDIVDKDINDQLAADGG